MKPAEVAALVEQIRADVTAERQQRDAQADTAQLAMKALQDENASLKGKVAELEADDELPPETVTALQELAAFVKQG